MTVRLSLSIVLAMSVGLISACGTSSDANSGDDGRDSGGSDAGGSGGIIEGGDGDAAGATGSGATTGSGASGGVTTGGGENGGDGSGGDESPGGTGVFCGDEVCDDGMACVADVAITAENIDCTPAGDTGCEGGCFIAVCDEHDDCPDSESCLYQLGESQRLLCTPTFGYGAVCSQSDDCPPTFPVCESLYDDPDILELLGWDPRICVADN